MTRLLPRHGTIGIAAPSSSVDPDRFARSSAYLKQLGYNIKCPLDPCNAYGSSQHHFASAPAQARIDALMELINDDDVDSIICIRGGYGCLELLPMLDFDALAKSDKFLVGYSDVTALLVSAFGLGKTNCVHGPVGCEFANANTDKDTLASVSILLDLLTNPEHSVSLSGTILREGASEGHLIIGNLTMLLTLVGTPWDVSYDGAILVIEDVGEAPYRIRRSLMQLKLSGKLDHLSAIVFGRFSRSDSKGGQTADEVISQSIYDIFAETNYPIISGASVGHNGKNIPLVLGSRARVDGDTLKTLVSP